LFAAPHPKQDQQRCVTVWDFLNLLMQVQLAWSDQLAPRIGARLAAQAKIIGGVPEPAPLDMASERQAEAVEQGLDEMPGGI
jgi:hypothetical protein